MAMRNKGLMLCYWYIFSMFFYITHSDLAVLCGTDQPYVTGPAKMDQVGT